SSRSGRRRSAPVRQVFRGRQHMFRRSPAALAAFLILAATSAGHAETTTGSAADSSSGGASTAPGDSVAIRGADALLNEAQRDRLQATDVRRDRRQDLRLVRRDLREGNVDARQGDLKAAREDRREARQ